MTNQDQSTPIRWFGRVLERLDGTEDDVHVVTSDVILSVFKNPYDRWDANLYVEGRLMVGTLGAESQEMAVHETEETALRNMQLWMRVCG